MRAEVPHLAWPLRLIGGQLAAVEQDTLAEVTQCVNVLLRTPRGARVLLPDFGVEDPSFVDGLDIDDALAQVARYEPRAVVDVDDDYIDEAGVQRTRLIVDLA
jgi:phage baseplate assembly protein W